MSNNEEILKATADAMCSFIQSLGDILSKAKDEQKKTNTDKSCCEECEYRDECRDSEDWEDDDASLDDEEFQEDPPEDAEEDEEESPEPDECADEEEDGPEDETYTQEEVDNLIDKYEDHLESHRKVIGSLVKTMQKIFKRLQNAKSVSKNRALMNAIERDIASATKHITSITDNI